MGILTIDNLTELDIGAIIRDVKTGVDYAIVDCDHVWDDEYTREIYYYVDFRPVNGNDDEVCYVHLSCDRYKDVTIDIGRDGAELSDFTIVAY